MYYNSYYELAVSAGVPASQEEHITVPVSVQWNAGDGVTRRGSQAGTQEQ